MSFPGITTGWNLGRITRPLNMGVAWAILATLTPFLIALGICFHVGSGAWWILRKMGVKLETPAQDPAQDDRMNRDEELKYLRSQHDEELNRLTCTSAEELIEANRKYNEHLDEVRTAHEKNLSQLKVILEEKLQFSVGMALKAPTQQEVDDAIRAAWGELWEHHEKVTCSQWIIALCRAILAGRREDRGI